MDTTRVVIPPPIRALLALTDLKGTLIRFKTILIEDIIDHRPQDGWVLIAIDLDDEERYEKWRETHMDLYLPSD